MYILNNKACIFDRISWLDELGSFHYKQISLLLNREKSELTKAQVFSKKPLQSLFVLHSSLPGDCTKVNKLCIGTFTLVRYLIIMTTAIILCTETFLNFKVIGFPHPPKALVCTAAVVNKSEEFILMKRGKFR